MPAQMSIGHLAIKGRVIGGDGHDPTAGVVDLLTGASAREHLLTVLSSAFGEDEVVVIRSLRCAVTLGAHPDAAPIGFAGSVVTACARLLRDHPTDDDCVVRFTDEAAYIAAYLHDSLAGRGDRWYYATFERFLRSDSSTDVAGLLTAHRAVRWRVLALVHANGDLDRVLAALGAEEIELVDDDMPPQTAWAALLSTATEIVRETVGSARALSTCEVEALTRTEPPPDWHDRESLGHAVAVASVAMLLPAALADVEVRDRLISAARSHDWFDPTRFRDTVTARITPSAENATAPPPVVPSRRVGHAVAALAGALSDPRLALDARSPDAPRNLVRLVAAMIASDRRWEGDELARSVAAQALLQWEVFRGSPKAGSSAAAPHSADQAKRDQALPARPVASSSAPRGAAPPDLSTVRHVPVPRAASTPADLVPLLVERFPSTPAPGPSVPSTSAASLLLVRSLLDLGLAPHLTAPVGSRDETLLEALLRRWSGISPTSDADADPVRRVTSEAAATLPSRSSPADIRRLAIARLLGLHHITEPLRTVAVPWGAAALAEVVIDDEDRLLPATPETLDGGLSTPTSVDDHPTRSLVADALGIVSAGDAGADDLLLDLIAASAAQAWARWLPGFAGASVPFLMTTFVRRPAMVEVTEDELVVTLESRSHDIVLELAGYLDPVEALAALGGRRVRFVMEESHGC